MEIVNKLRVKYYLYFVIFFYMVGCGEVKSSYNSTIIKSESYFSNLTENEKNLLSELNTTQQALLDEINRVRAKTQSCGERGIFPSVAPLTWNANLYASALEHARDLAYSNTFAHDGSGTEYDITGNGRSSKFYERIEANGYTNYLTVGENIAGGYRSVEEVMRAWMASPTHCANIMKANYREVGMAIFFKAGSNYQYYWVQNFGSRRG